MDLGGDVVVRSLYAIRSARVEDDDDDKDDDEKREAREEGDDFAEKMCECAETQGDCTEGSVACV